MVQELPEQTNWKIVKCNLGPNPETCEGLGKTPGEPLSISCLPELGDFYLAWPLHSSPAQRIMLLLLDKENLRCDMPGMK